MLSSGNVIGTFFYYISHTNNFFWENILEDIAETLGNIFHFLTAKNRFAKFS